MPELGSFAGCHIPAAAEPDQGAPTPPRSHLLKDSSLLAVPFLQLYCPRGSPTEMLSQGLVMRDQCQGLVSQDCVKGSVNQGWMSGVWCHRVCCVGGVVAPLNCTQCWESRAQTSAQTSLPSLSHIGSAHHAPSGPAAALRTAGVREELLGWMFHLSSCCSCSQGSS